jgi:hypothetical protein
MLHIWNSLGTLIWWTPGYVSPPIYHVSLCVGVFHEVGVSSKVGVSLDVSVSAEVDMSAKWVWLLKWAHLLSGCGP